MIYEKNYREQVFWDIDRRPTLSDIRRMVLDNAMQQRITQPAGPAFKPGMAAVGIAALVGVLAGVVSWLVTKSGVFGLVMGMLVFFLGGIVAALFIARIILVTEPAKMTAEVNAKCEGYSVSSSNNHPIRTPVFSYTYNGREYLAYDGVYTNHDRMPAIDEYMTIRVDPENPENFTWSGSRNSKSFVFAVVIGAIMFIADIAMIVLTINTPGLR